MIKCCFVIFPFFLSALQWQLSETQNTLEETRQTASQREEGKLGNENERKAMLATENNRQASFLAGDTYSIGSQFKTWL